jgi:hypothetical protein
MEHSDQLDAVCYRPIYDRVAFEVVPPQLRMEPFVTPAEDKRGIRQLLAFPLDGVDEAVGISQAVLSDVKTDLSQVPFCCLKPPDRPHYPRSPLRAPASSRMLLFSSEKSMGVAGPLASRVSISD